LTQRILIAGIGNIFRGDDAFGIEVVQRLVSRSFPPGVLVADFGTRGHDLAYAILDGYDSVILLDATTRGGEPGTLYTLELNAGKLGARSLDTHGVDLPSVFNLVRVMGGTLPHLFLVGCEPGELGSAEEGAVGLSEPVLAAIERAVGLVEVVVADAIREPHRA